MRAVVLAGLLGCDGALGIATTVPADTLGADAPGPPACPSSYTTLGTSQYRLATVGADFVQAEGDCASDQIAGSSRYTHLAVIHSLAELGMIAQLVGNNDAWVGLTDLKDNATWRWITDELPDLATTSMLWASNQPNMNGAASVLGGALFANGRLAGLPYLCECDAFPPDLARALP